MATESTTAGDGGVVERIALAGVVVDVASMAGMGYFLYERPVYGAAVGVFAGLVSGVGLYLALTGLVAVGRDSSRPSTGPEVLGRPVHPIAAGFGLTVVGLCTLLVGYFAGSVLMGLLVGVGIAVPEYLVVSLVFPVREGDAADAAGTG